MVLVAKAEFEIHGEKEWGLIVGSPTGFVPNFL